jgi:hypothetical protein
MWSGLMISKGRQSHFYRAQNTFESGYHSTPSSEKSRTPDFYISLGNTYRALAVYQILNDHFTMSLLNVIFILMSGISFFLYGSQVLISPKMNMEFKRFGLEKLQKPTGILQLLGGLGLLTGLLLAQNMLLLISSGGLALLMLFGFGVRLKVKDGFWLSFPAFFFLLLNVYIFAMVMYAGTSGPTHQN